MSDRVHLVGIGGSGMSGLARLLLAQGRRVSGSDLREVELPGAEIFLGHHPENVPQDARIVVHSPAIPTSNPELEIARKNGMEMVTYPEMLGRLMSEKTGIAVSGTHGKTTTAAMLAFILARAGLEPSYICGAGIP
ncbi:MAG: Mur ligase domain-containing protein, partial [Planctomycetota bacterium]